jgi:hypothetical protein
MSEDYPPILDLDNIKRCNINCRYRLEINLIDNEDRRYRIDDYLLAKVLRHGIRKLKVVKKNKSLSFI